MHQQTHVTVLQSGNVHPVQRGLNGSTLASCHLCGATWIVCVLLSLAQYIRLIILTVVNIQIWKRLDAVDCMRSEACVCMVDGLSKHKEHKMDKNADLKHTIVEQPGPRCNYLHRLLHFCSRCIERVHHLVVIDAMYPVPSGRNCARIKIRGYLCPALEGLHDL